VVDGEVGLHGEEAAVEAADLACAAAQLGHENVFGPDAGRVDVLLA